MKNNEAVDAIFGKFDHTALGIATTVDDIKKLCDEALKYHTASVCVPPCYVKEARKLLGSRMRITTVVSFPGGNATTETKVFECKNAIKNGADELDVVVNIGMIKKRKYDDIAKELEELRKACKNKILKVIIEAPLLSGDEQIAMCTIATSAGVDYIKTCTGFGTVATEADVARIVKNVGNDVKVKASGGIKTLKDAEKFLALGAERIGESSIIASIEK